jgi:hypothetical protein
MSLETIPQKMVLYLNVLYMFYSQYPLLPSIFL